MEEQGTKQKYRLGLALSGGGARGFAHLGVVQAMYEDGIRPDIISGTSAGSIVGAMLAAGHTPEECLTFFTGKKMLNFARPTVSKKGILIMNGMEERLQEFLHVHTFEELEIPLVITACDINHARPVHFEKGELVPCVIASSSIPVVFAPREINHIDYVDGGVFMNLPVRPIRHKCEKIIGVEINSVDTDEKVSNMLNVAARAFHLGVNCNTDIDKTLCDFLIAPQHMTKYSMFDLDHVREIYEEGYKTARKALKNIVPLISQPVLSAS